MTSTPEQKARAKHRERMRHYIMELEAKSFGSKAEQARIQEIKDEFLRCFDPKRKDK